ncbi:MAG: ferrous iron transport protein A [Candidatus Cloacimonetes bacterium]|nr:ferrous iron transport protein A [Candidatus Cloacimonadota bacterium]MBL7148701.1 ferrous iron transport protein A [Candidatus Cloacimonadota bacterium]
MKLKDMEVGSNVKVIGYTTKDRHYREKLLRMGLVKGAEFSITRKAPLGDPMEIKLKGFNLTLRKAEADALEVEEI